MHPALGWLAVQVLAKVGGGGELHRWPLRPGTRYPRLIKVNREFFIKY
jgi:hypothetical protein